MTGFNSLVINILHLLRVEKLGDELLWRFLLTSINKFLKIYFWALILLSYFVIFEKRNLYKKIEVRFDFEVSKISAQKFGDKKIKNSQTVPPLIFSKKTNFEYDLDSQWKKMWAFDKIAWVIFTKNRGLTPGGSHAQKFLNFFWKKQFYNKESSWPKIYGKRKHF